jgi:DNA-binding CsgD family transcriptional regulator
MTQRFLEHRQRSLSPRERQALVRLLAGDAEKEAARALGCSVNTFHDYAKKLYRFFDVDSRAQLMARFIDMRGREVRNNLVESESDLV